MTNSFNEGRSGPENEYGTIKMAKEKAEKKCIFQA
jgi:hypothetical protein